MNGNILYGAAQYGGSPFGVSVAEVTTDISQSTGGVLFRGRAVLSSYPSVHVRNTNLDLLIDFSKDKFRSGLSIGGYISYRNKQGGAITITPTGSSLIEGSGAVTNDSTKVGSLYIEDATTIVTIGDLS